MRLFASLALLLALAADARAALVEGGKPEKPEPVEASAERVLRTKDFPFCRDNELPVTGGDRDWCDVADEATTCPQLKEMCARPTDGSAGQGKGAHGEGPKKKPKSGIGEGNDGEASSFDLNFSLPGMAFLPWIALGLVLALILFIVVRAMRDRRKELPPGDLTPLPEPSNGPLEVLDPGLGEVQLLLRRALDLADRDVGLALSCLYAAVLKHLEEKQLIVWDVTTTNREYVRAVRGRTPIDRPMAELVREVEKTKFGHAAPARSRFDALYGAIAPQLARIAAVLLLGLALSGCGHCGGDPGLDGRAAFTEILRSQGIQVSRFALPIDHLTGSDAPVLVDSRDFALDERVLGALEKATLAGARVLVLLHEDPEPFEAWPSLSVKEDTAGALVPSPEFALATAFPPGLAGSLQGKLRLVVPPEERDAPEVLVTRAGAPFVVRWKSDHGQLTFVADRRLFANGAMAIPADARLAVALALDTAGEQKALQYASLGPTAPAESPADSLEKAGLWALVLQAVAAAAVWFLAKGLAFGTLRDRSEARRRAFSEHVGALGIQLMSRGGSRLATSLYVGWALERLRQRANRDVDRKDPRALAKDLAPRVGESEDDLRLLLEHAEAMRREPAGISVPERDFAVMRRLHQLLNRLQAAGRRAA